MGNRGSRASHDSEALSSFTPHLTHYFVFRAKFVFRTDVENGRPVVAVANVTDLGDRQRITNNDGEFIS